MQTGQFDIENRTFDISHLSETETSLSITCNKISMMYRDESNNLIKLTKTLTDDPMVGKRGDYLVASDVKENYIGGYCTLSKQNNKTKTCIGKLLADTSDHSKFTFKTFADQNGIQRTALLVPVSL